MAIGKAIRTGLLALLPMLILGSVFIAAQPPKPVSACTDPGSGTAILELIPSWHKYLECDANGLVIIDFSVNEEGVKDYSQIWKIAAAVLEMITRIGAIIAVIFIMYGGFKFITSGGNPDQAAQARQTIIYSIVGFMIAVSATVFISFLMNVLIDNTANSAGIPDADTGSIGTIFRFAYAIAGALSVMMIVISGLRYVLSSGDPAKTNTAKNTLIYSVVGLIVVIFAATILEYVVGQL